MLEGPQEQAGDENRAIYNDEMQGKVARGTLGELMPFFEEVIREIEEP
ncbi:MAG: hypothetical protein M3Q18_10965 [Actinomycetota bacterium]|nr:hypothetical protein [Actinomycetota bacterium]